MTGGDIVAVVVCFVFFAAYVIPAMIFAVIVNDNGGDDKTDGSNNTN